MEAFFEIGKKVKISQRAFDGLNPTIFPEAIAARGKIVTLTDWVEPSSDEPVWEATTDNGEHVYLTTDEIECIDPVDELRRRVLAALDESAGESEWERGHDSAISMVSTWIASLFPEVQG